MSIHVVKRIGITHPGESFHGEIAGVVFCAEEAVLQPGILSTIIDWKDRDYFCAEGIKRVIVCAPITDKVHEERSLGWMPFLSNGELNHIETMLQFILITVFNIYSIIDAGLTLLINLFSVPHLF